MMHLLTNFLAIHMTYYIIINSRKEQQQFFPIRLVVLSLWEPSEKMHMHAKLPFSQILT